jgi:hypothetical protein
VEALNASLTIALRILVNRIHDLFGLYCDYCIEDLHLLIFKITASNC